MNPNRRTRPIPLAAALLGACILGTFSTLARSASGSELDAVLDQSRNAPAQNDFLPPEQAFRLSATAAREAGVRLDWIIAPGYYLYRDRIHIAEDRNQIGAPQFPEGQVKNDEYFGRQVVYHNELVTIVPIVSSAGTAAPSSVSLHVT
ncbi:MAG: protein-disulfide reductase DsbD domain-containing protein, partial [Steroidobacteraceae bacterium]